MWVVENDCFNYQGDNYCRVVGVPTTRFEIIGVLSREGEEPRPLFGRRTERTSAEWYYYTTNQDQTLKLPVIHLKRDCLNTQRGCPELQSGDVVSVQGVFGQFTVVLNKN